MFDHSKQSWSSKGLDRVRLFSGIFSVSCSLTPTPKPKVELVVYWDVAGLSHYQPVWKILPSTGSPALPHQTLQQALQPGTVLQAAELAGERSV